jgi:hypothetical protein
MGRLRTYLCAASITEMRLAFTTRHVIATRALIHPRLTPGTRPRKLIKPILVRLLFFPLLYHPRQLFLAVPFLER